VTSAPHLSTNELAERLGAFARVCDVVSTKTISPSLREVVLGGAAQLLAGQPGNDVMVRVAGGSQKFVRRRFSVRSLDAEQDQFTLWITTEHDGPGSDWARRAVPGETVDVIGPRGKVLIDPTAHWHLFLGDVSGLGTFYRMAQSLEAPRRAIFIVEALLVGFVGAALGWVLGYLLSRGLASLEFKTPFSDYNHLPVLYSAKHYLLATGVALFSSLVAGYFPARAAARLHPVDIIRGAT